MKKFFSFFLILMLIVTSSCSMSVNALPKHYVPQVRMDVHADTSFTRHERDLIRIAVQRMFDQTNGFVQFNLVFDLDFESMDSLKEHASHNLLTRTGSDAKDLEKDTIGYCIVNYEDLDFVRTTKAALIYDRLKTDDAWIHVTMHEMFHMIRVHHVGVKRTIMFKSTPVTGKGIITCMTATDMAELCSTHGCDLAAMKPCSP